MATFMATSGNLWQLKTKIQNIQIKYMIGTKFGGNQSNNTVVIEFWPHFWHFKTLCIVMDYCVFYSNVMNL